MYSDERPLQQSGPAVIKSADGRPYFTGIIVAVAVNQLFGQVSQCTHLLVPRQHFRFQPLSSNNTAVTPSHIGLFSRRTARCKLVDINVDFYVLYSTLHRNF